MGRTPPQVAVFHRLFATVKSIGKFLRLYLHPAICNQRAWVKKKHGVVFGWGGTNVITATCCEIGGPTTSGTGSAFPPGGPPGSPPTTTVAAAVEAGMRSATAAAEDAVAGVSGILDPAPSSENPTESPVGLTVRRFFGGCDLWDDDDIYGAAPWCCKWQSEKLYTYWT
jgi:hypothetical protein